MSDAITLPTITDRWTTEQIEGFYADGHWRRESLWDEVVSAADRSGDQVLLTDGDVELTYTQLRDQSLAFAATLHRLGLRKGDRILVQTPNWVEFAVCLIGASRAGVITVPTMTIYRGDDVAYVIEHSGARLVVSAGEFNGFDYGEMHRRLREQNPAVEHLMLVRGTPQGDELSFADAVATMPDEATAAGIEASGPDDGHLIIYTSGTTSRPKGCFHTWNTVQFTTRTMMKGFGWTADDVAFGPSPIAHATGYQISVIAPLLLGARSYIMPAFAPAPALEAIKAHGCTYTITATAFLQMLIDAYDPALHDASSMRVWTCAGSPIPASVVEEGRKILEGCNIQSLYGRSENFLTTMCPVEDPAERSLTSDGRALDGIEVKLFDEMGQEVPTGEEGDIGYRGPGHMLAYFRNPEQTDALFTADGFSLSGDLGRMDADGYVRVTGRLKDIIIRGGLNIAVREIEDLLGRHPAVASVAVVAMPDRRLGEKACAYVTVAAGESFDFEEMTRYLRDDHDIAAQKRPERLEIVEAFPMTATGKIQKHVLRQEIAAKVEQEQASPA